MYAQYHLVGEMSCNGGSHMVWGAVDACVEVVDVRKVAGQHRMGQMNVLKE